MSSWTQIRRLARTIRPPAEPHHGFRNCLVHHTVSGGSDDGKTAVFVSRGGDVFPAPYLDSYNAATAAQGDLVRVEFANGSPLIHGRVVGLPNLN